MVELFTSEGEAAQKRRLQAIEHIKEVATAPIDYPRSNMDLLAKVSAVNLEAALAVVGIARNNPDKVQCRYFEFRPGRGCIDAHGEEAVAELGRGPLKGGAFSIEFAVGEDRARATINFFERGWCGPTVDLSAYSSAYGSSYLKNQARGDLSSYFQLARSAIMPFKMTEGANLQDEDTEAVSQYIFGRTKSRWQGDRNEFYPFTQNELLLLDTEDLKLTKQLGKKGLYYSYVRAGLADLAVASGL